MDNRQSYYERVKELAEDKGGLFYVVGSDEFIVQNIELLREQGILKEQILLDKHTVQLPKYFTA